MINAFAANVKSRRRDILQVANDQILWATMEHSFHTILYLYPNTWSDSEIELLLSTLVIENYTWIKDDKYIKILWETPV